MMILKNEGRYHLKIFAAFLVLAIALFSVSIMDHLKTGVGFGKDARFIVRTEKKEDLDTFIRESYYEGRETRKAMISDNRYLITVSGLDQLSDYENLMMEKVSDLKILASGSFGSITRLQNNQSFVAVYFLVLALAVVAYFLNRFRFLGIFAVIEIFFLLIIALASSQWMGYPFTKTLWYAMLVGLMLLLYQKQALYSHLKGKSLGEVLKKSQGFRPYQLYYMASFLTLSMLLYASSQYHFYPVASFFLMLSVWIFFVYLLKCYFLFPLVLHLTEGAKDLYFDDYPIFTWRQNAEKSFKWIKRTILVALVITLASAAFFGMEYREGKDFSEQNVMIVGDSQPDTYLQIQAILYREGFFEKQIDYEVSEQESLWISFDQKVTYLDLDYLQRLVTDELDLDVWFYKTYALPNPLTDAVYYSRLLLSVLLAVAIYALLSPETIIWPVLLASSISVLFFIFFVLTFKITWSREILLLTWLIPYVSVSLSLYEEKLFHQMAYREAFLDLSASNLVYLVMMSFPILVVVPTNIALEMVGVFTILFLSVHLGFYFVSLAKKRWNV